MLNMIDDGVWCNRCKRYHPTLMWHKKYGKEQSQDGMIERFKETAEKRPGMFGFNNDTNEDEKAKILEKTIKSNLELRSIDDAEIGECAVCGYLTSFISKKTGRHVCSDECLYKENGWGEDATGEAIMLG